MLLNHKTTRVCILHNECDILCSRPSIWGNPYSYKENTLAKFKVDTRQQSIDLYKDYLLNNEYLMSKITQLIGKKLGCYCKLDRKCHVDILIDICNEFNRKSIF